jgi:hypothetical protein
MRHTANNLFNLTDCWLSPKGEIVIGDDEFDGNTFHEELALCLIRDLKGFAGKREAYCWLRDVFGNKDAYDWLEEEGWIRLHSMRRIERARWITYEDQRMTFQQKQKIRQWCKVNGKTWKDAVWVC